MTTRPSILITGATGTVGRAVLDRILLTKVDVRATTRDEAKAKSLQDRGVPAAVVDFLQPHTLRAALEGVTVVLLTTPICPQQVAQAKSVIKAASESAHPPRIVRLSVQKAAHDAPARVGRQHAEIEDALVSSGLPYTILRPQSFMQNTLLVASSLATDGTIYQPFKDARLAMIDARDVGEVAAKVLVGQGHDGKVYTLTGPATISFDDIAQALGRLVGKPVRYVDVPIGTAKQAMLRRGVTEWLADALNEYAKAHTEGYSDYTTGDFELVTGHAAMSYSQFARDFAQVFRGGRVTAQDIPLPGW
jgi:uncharacterized protein YbjT (DUF2867 family)